MTRAAILTFRLAFIASIIGATWLSLTPNPVQVGPSDKVDHASAYYVLTVFADFAFPSAGALLKGLSLFGYGVLMEVLQRYVPGRFYELADMAANGAGILLYAVSIPLLKRIPVIRRRWG